jgi:hypothetical protein
VSLADGFLALGHGDGNWESGCIFYLLVSWF